MGQTEHNRKTILLVDDENEILKMMTKMLEVGGYEVIPVNTPESALQESLSRREGLHLVISDVMMPGMNGIELCERIQTAFPGTRCLYMSGHAPESLNINGVLKANLNFIRKPFGLKSLLDMVARILE
ncbi:MAG: response regulator [Chlorobium phaeovibrioides]|nr:response regulator [Chlorobium phaeovibrioides]